MKRPTKTPVRNGRPATTTSLESAKAAARQQSAADEKARDAKTARLRAQRLAQGADDGAPAAGGAPGTFKKAPPRKKQAVSQVALSPDAKERYERLARERDERQRGYEGHLPPTPRR